MERKSKARRRFHTDRIVAKRRARWIREDRTYAEYADSGWTKRKLSYGYLASRDPWDCGRPRCGICHAEPDYGERAREKREWQRDAYLND